MRRFVSWSAREYAVDRGRTGLSDDRQTLVGALRKIEAHARRVVLDSADRHLGAAPMRVVAPFAGAGLAGLLRTPPASGERVRRLLGLARRGG